MSGLRSQSLIAAWLVVRGLGRGLACGVLAALVSSGSAMAGVVFDNCITAADGSISCDTKPTGNTLADDEAARYGLFDQASPGWAEYSPYEGYDQMLGGGDW